MYSVFIEMPSGAKSIPHVDADFSHIDEIADGFVSQMKKWPKFEATVVVMDGATEHHRIRVVNA